MFTPLLKAVQEVCERYVPSMLFESAMYQHKSENCAINYPNVIFDFHIVTPVGGN